MGLTGPEYWPFRCTNKRNLLGLISGILNEIPLYMGLVENTISNGFNCLSNNECLVCWKLIVLCYR